MKYKIIEKKDHDGNFYYEVKKKFLWFWVPVRFESEYKCYERAHESEIKYSQYVFSSKDVAIETIKHFLQGEMQYKGYFLNPVILDGSFNNGYYLPNDTGSNHLHSFYKTVGSLDECKKRIDELIEFKNNAKYHNEFICEIENQNRKFPS